MKIQTPDGEHQYLLPDDDGLLDGEEVNGDGALAAGGCTPTDPTAFDSDGDGTISAKEIREVMWEMGECIDEGDIAGVMGDIDANGETPPKYGIRGIPTLMLFKNGNVEATKVGALSKSQLTAFLDSNI